MDEKEEYIPRCPHCGDEVLELDAFVLEENGYTVELASLRSSLQWSISEVIESTAIRTVYKCPNCEETLFEVRSGESDPQVVIDFLKGVRMTHVQDSGVRGMVPGTLSNQLRIMLESLNNLDKPEGAYYAEGFPQKGGITGIYFVDPTSTEKGIDPYET